MQFLVYFAVLAITIAGAALGLDALTAPPPELKEKIAANALASKPRQIPIDRPAPASVAPVDETVTTPTPIAPAPAVVAAPAPAVVAAPAAVAPPAPGAVAENSGVAPAAAVAAVQPAPAVAPSQTPAAVETPADAVASAQFTATPAAATANSCNIQACAAAYRSFRESDCTYQPFEGERRLCERTEQDTIAVSRPPEPVVRSAGPRNEWTARSNSRDAELRAVERRVRELTQEEFDDRMYSRRNRRVIVVETPYGEDYVTPESYSRRWRSPGW